MSFQRQFNRKHRKLVMRELTFAPESYEYNEDKKAFIFKGTNSVGLFELLYTGIQISKVDLTKADHKVIKRLKLKLKEISRYKDKDEDSRILSEGEQTVILEEDELNILKKVLEPVPYTASISELVSDIWDLLDGAKEYTLPPKLAPSPDPLKLVSNTE